MKTLDALPRMYEELANHYARHGESRQRDNCLVLAADAALSADMPEEAERLRKRLLLTNPHHLVRPYSSMGEAMQSDDVRDFVSDLRRQLPPDMVAKLLNQSPTARPQATTSRPQPAAAPVPRQASKRPSALSYGMSVAVLLAGIVITGGLLFAALLWPFVE